MAIKASNIIVGDKVVDSITEPTTPPAPALVKQRTVRDTSINETEAETNNKSASQYMLDMGAADKINSLFD